jgi:hypothetical protein
VFLRVDFDLKGQCLVNRETGGKHVVQIWRGLRCIGHYPAIH